MRLLILRLNCYSSYVGGSFFLVPVAAASLSSEPGYVDLRKGDAKCVEDW